MRTIRLFIVVGARPNFMKAAPIVHCVNERNAGNENNGLQFEQVLVHTGQHYDREMSEVFFRDLQLPRPDINLEVGSGTQAEQTGRVMIAFEKVTTKLKPDLVIVMGDVNSTVACALASAKLNIPVAHIEAGLRSFDRTMPEEINRVVTDHVSTYLFTTSRFANDNLSGEGINGDNVFFVGNVMIDSLLRFKQQACARNTLSKLKLSRHGYAVLTLHRPSNVDDPSRLQQILEALETIQRALPVVFPAHPRVLDRVLSGSISKWLHRMEHLSVITPLGYLDFLCLINNARLVLTDSGGLQEETTVLGIPCLTLRENTERPETVAEGTNVLVGCDRERIVVEASKAMQGGIKKAATPELWDGRSAERIVDTLAMIFGRCGRPTTVSRQTKEATARGELKL